MARPKIDDPAKYTKALRAHRLAAPQAIAVSGPRRIEECAEVIAWAIAEGLAGFAEGETVGVAAAAEGLGASRSTVARAVERLRSQGQLIAETPKSPYVITARRPVIDPQWLASVPISATQQLREDGGASILDEPRVLRRTSRDPYAALLRHALARTSDVAVHRSLDLDACRARWDEDLGLFRRLRFRTRGGKRRAWLYEATFLALPPALWARTEDNLRFLLQRETPLVSLSNVLPQDEVKQLVNGPTRIALGAIPDELRPDVRQLAKRHKLDLSLLLPPRSPAPTLLRWEYGHFATIPTGLITFSICFMDPELVHVYAKELHVQRPEQWK